MSDTVDDLPPPPSTPPEPVEVDAPPDQQTETPPQSKNPPPPASVADVAADVMMWRRKYWSMLVLTAATAAWVTMKVYKFSFVTLASYASMIVLALLFLLGNIQRLLGVEAPDLSEMEVISERSAVEMANRVQETVRGGARWIFRVCSTATKRDGIMFAATLFSLWILSWIGQFFDFLTFVYTGVVVLLTVPAIYVKYEDRFNEYEQRIKMQSERGYKMMQDKAVMLKNKAAATTAGKKKEKKVE